MAVPAERDVVIAIRPTGIAESGSNADDIGEDPNKAPQVYDHRIFLL